MVVELCLLLTIYGCNLDRTFLHPFWDSECKVADVIILNGHFSTVDGQRQWCIRIIHEIVSIDGSLLTGFSPLIAHVVDAWSRHQNLEVISGGIVVIVDHKDLIKHLTRNLTRHGHDHGIVGNQAWHQLGLLIIEKHLGDASQILTNYADIIVHVSTR